MDRVSFSSRRFAAWLAWEGIRRPRLDSGQLALDDETFRQMARTHPKAAPLRELRHSLGEIGKLLWRGAHRRQAIAMFTECIALYRRLNDPAQMAIMLGILGVVHEEQGEFAAALKPFEQASRLCAQFCPRQLPVAQVAIARVKAKMEASG